MLADLHLPIRPRSDLALLNGLIHIIIEHGLVDRDYIDAHTTGFDELRESVRDYTPERVAEITGLDAGACSTGPRRSTPAPGPAFIAWTMGVNHSTQGHRDRQRDQQPRADHRQHRPRRRGAVLDHRPVQRDGHARGRLRVEHARLPQVRESPRDRAELAALWNVPVERIPTARGLAYPDIIEAALDKRIRALWIIATNPIVSFPNLGVLTQALEGLEFLVVQDGFHPTPTTEFADLVLPAAIWGEKEGTYTNSERRVSKVEPRRATRRAKRAPTSTSSSTWRPRSACATSSFRAGRRRATPSTSGARLGRPPLRLLGHDLRGDRSSTAASSGRFPRAPPTPDASRRLYADGVFQTADGTRAAAAGASGSRFPSSRTPSFRSC